jgi:hypothetical protein
MERKESFMIRRFLSACVGVALLGALAVSSRVDAKPPDLPEDGNFTVKPAVSPPMPHEDADVTCPYLRQKIDVRSYQPVDPQMSRGVMYNLLQLNRADKLLDQAKELARTGFIDEAMDCCARAAKLCPGSPCAKRATDTMFDLALGFVVPVGASEEPAEDATPPVPPTIDYEFEVDASINGGLRLCADCSLGGNVYHLRYKYGCLSIWRTADGGKTKP